MHPILFEIGGFPVRSYGVALLVAFAIGIWLAHRRAVRLALEGERMLDLSIVILASAIIGSRLLWAATHIDRFRAPAGRWLDLLDPFAGASIPGIQGLSMMGGVVLALAASFVFLRLRGLPALRYADAAAPSIPLGEGITRIGCLLNGCCFGRHCDWPWGVRFPTGSAAATVFGDATLHPTQIYASLAGFALFGLLYRLSPRTLPAGVVVCACLVGIGLLRLAVDTVRYHEPKTVILGAAGFTTSQALALGLVLTGVLGLLLIARRAGR